MESRFYTSLPAEAIYVRETVFMNEQKFTDEFDEIDQHALHLVLFDKAKPVATGRLFAGQENDTWIFGRIAVLKSHRAKHLGSHLLKELEEKAQSLGAKRIELSAQYAARNFYQKQGYRSFGPTYISEDCPHIKMEKIIKGPIIPEK